MEENKLINLIRLKASGAIQEKELSDYDGKKIAIDMNSIMNQYIMDYKSESGNLYTTAHLKGILEKTIVLLENGIKPVFVFDGESPTLKIRSEGEILKGNEKFYEEAKELLKLMGMSYIEATSDAIAQCFEMMNCDKVDYIATDDMNALLFGAKILLLNMTNLSREKLIEVNLKLVLDGLNFKNHDQLIDLCILLGFGNCGTIYGIDETKAFDLITFHKSIEAILEDETSSFEFPKNWEYKAVQDLFKNPKVNNFKIFTYKTKREFLDSKNIVLKWSSPDEKLLLNFLCKKRNCKKQKKVEKDIEKIRNAVQKINLPQINHFFSLSS